MRYLQSSLGFLGVLGLVISLFFGFFIEHFYGQVPCSLCFLQRAAMLGIGMGLYFNIRYGIRLQNYAISLFWALFGEAAALRHMALNICEVPTEAPFFFWSYRIYTWSFMIFFLSILGIGLMILLHSKEGDKSNCLIRWGSFFLLLFCLGMSTFSVFFK